MIRAQRRDLVFAAVLVALIGLFGLLASSPVLQATLSTACLAVVVLHVAGADEVRRASAFRAGFTAFMLAAAISVGATTLGRSDLLASSAATLWAWLIGLYLISWIGHALIRT